MEYLQWRSPYMLTARVLNTNCQSCHDNSKPCGCTVRVFMKALYLPLTHNLPPISWSVILENAKSVEYIMPVCWGDYHSVMQIDYDDISIQVLVSESIEPRRGLGRQGL